jgi:hypothetical protein
LIYHSKIIFIKNMYIDKITLNIKINKYSKNRF